MAEKINMPKLGFDMAEGTLVKWVIPEGEEVSKGQVLAEIETDKATVEVESSFSGVLSKHLVNEGDVVPVGEPIAIVGAPGEVGEETPGGGIEADPTGPSDETAEVRMTPKPGKEEEVKRDVEAQKEEQTPGEPELKVTEPEQPPKEKPLAESPTGDGKFPEGVRASPVARRLADDQGLDLKQLQGSGPGGRIVRKDVEAALERPETVAPAPEPSPERPGAPTPTKAPAPVAWTPPGPAPEDQVQAIGKLRAAIGRRMVESKQQVPHFYITSEYDVEALMQLRKQLNEYLPDDQKISVNDFIIKATALALRQFPNLNASLRDNEIIRHGGVHIGVAVAVEGGLLTVVSRDTDQKPLRVISTEVRDMVARARSGKVRPEDIEGSTFSVSNLGMFDVEHFVAIVNPPEAAILAVGSVKQKPVVVDGELTVGTRMQVTLSADHRITDGAEGAQFMQTLRDFLESPLKLVL
jgi:pyruvate dehydrogenase E2 component (dihydrolipoamide acetyltransferase)